MTPENYTISGALNSIALEGSNVSKDEFLSMKTVKKEILYSDRNFIIRGKIFACNSSTPLAGITVVLENTDEAFKKTTITDAGGTLCCTCHKPVTSLYMVRKTVIFRR